MSQDELQKLINLISRLPGIGQRSAQRIALYLIKNKQELMLPLGDSVKETAAVIKKCDNCGILDVIIPCKICSSDNRSKKTICIVEDWIQHVIFGGMVKFGKHSRLKICRR